MKATEAKLLEFLKKSPQFLIPIYQRAYSWTERECAQLWADIMNAGRNDKVSAHFVGSIVYVEQGLYQVSSQAPLLVIDGQQRLTTVTLLIEALARAVGETEPMDGFSARKLRNYYLLNPEEDHERRFKLLLSQTDKASLIALLTSQPKPKEASLRIQANFELFEKWVAAAKGDLAAVCRGIAKLIVVDISLNRDSDNPQLIFESLNSTGRKLSQADLIRNYVLMGLEPKLQTRLYEHFWRPMEVEFGQEAYATEFDSFMRHYLTLKTGEIPNVNDVYEAFKMLAVSSGAGDVEELVKEIRSFASHYCRIALDAGADPALKDVFHDIRELRVEVAYPFLLELYDDFSCGALSKADLTTATRLVESYVFRRAVCSIPTNSLNKTFANFGKALRKSHYLESIRATFLTLPSYRRFPGDAEFEMAFQTRDLYTFRNRSYWLRRLENHERKERVPVQDYTIEHIMPQNEKLRSEWQIALGADWQRVQAEWLHRPGNLTLTGYNSEYSDRPFQEKRDMDGGFANSPLNLNKGLGQLDTWNEGSIKARGDRLAKIASEVWGAPKLPLVILEGYRPKAATSNYFLADHPHLASGPARALFDAFRVEALSLNPCVVEEVLKLYIAYKAETNFVDVVPQAKTLRLSLNVGFHEIDDPHGLCKDVSNIGRWGNGDVEVRLTKLDELPYVMALVRQSFERQMGTGAPA
jgi:uncharacterized protein with ParB-like and HNH nuclease domain/predicted transport protein